MVARAFVPECLFDEHEIGRRPDGDNLPSRRDADQQLAARDEELFCQQDRERTADRAANDAEVHSTALAAVKRCVVASPDGIVFGLMTLQQVRDDVAVRIEDTHRGDAAAGQRLLASRLPQ